MPASDDPLAGIGLFRSIPAELRHRIYEQGELETLAPGRVLFREGEPGEQLFALLEGRIVITKRRQDGQSVQVGVLQPGGAGGITSLFLDQPRSATLTAAASGATVWTLPKDRTLSLVATEPVVARTLIGHLAERCRAGTSSVAELLGNAEDAGRMRVAVFDAKTYDRHSLHPAAGDDLAFHFFEPRLSLETTALASGFEAVCVFVNDRLDAAVLEQLASLGVGGIALRCAGFNNVDLEACRNLGLRVARVPAYSPHAVAEHAVGLALALNRRLHRAYARVRNGDFTLDGLVGFDLHGRCAGVIGVGAIGRCAVGILRGFGMQVLGWDARPDPGFAESSGLRYAPLEEVLATSDLLTLHAPLLPETHHLIDAAAIATMKRGAMLINTSRGGLIDTDALIAGLRSGRIGAAGLDVYEEEAGLFFEDHSEHIIQDQRLTQLLAFPNVLITSHQAFLTQDALANIATTTATNLRQLRAGTLSGPTVVV